MNRYGLRRRIVLVVVATAALTSVLFGLITFIFAYSLEDRLFSDEVGREVARQLDAWPERPAPRLPYVRIVRSEADLPTDLAPQLRAHPQGQEFFGQDGRHYHVKRFAIPRPTGGEAVAVAETSRYLLVRPVREKLLLSLAGISLVVALIAALVGWWLSRLAVSPLVRLASDLQTAGSDVPRIDARAYPANEVGVLAEGLENAFDRIRRFVARERDFTRDASHELRTPLAVIAGAAEGIATEPELPTSARRALGRIQTATADMVQALDLLLALAREGGPLLQGPVLLRPLVEKALASAATRFPDRDMKTVVKVPAEAAVLAPETALQLVINNLIGNAFQHAPGSTLRVIGDRRRLLIADDGPGISRRNTTRGAPGSGLGLSIVKRLCKAADIGLSSKRTEAGAGTRFYLRFASRGEWRARQDSNLRPQA